MKPVSPVIPNKESSEVTYAKDQPEYNALPALKAEDGMVTTRWHMTWRERVRVLLCGDIYVQILTFNRPLQPIKLQVETPEA